jgi:hypothetical protein
MDTNRLIANLTAAMIEFDAGDPRRINHLLKVHDLARTIGVLEGLEGDALFTLEAAALVHDIAILPCEEELGRCDGEVQEKYGPMYAAGVLKEVKIPQEISQRVCWLVGHHHTYTNVTELDHRILLEADCLVNLYEDECDGAAVQAALERVFATDTGRQLCENLFADRI